MGGPWRERGFDSGAWRPPAPRVEAEPSPAGGQDRLTGIVVGYIVAVLASMAVLVGAMKAGW